MPKSAGRPNLDPYALSAAAFLHDMAGTRIGPVGVSFSSRFKDATWYSNGRIYINPKYNPEGLDYGEMVAHEFFHHAQERMHACLEENQVESSAMFFAAAYVCRRDGGGAVRKRIIRYMGQKAHTPEGGNRFALAAFRRCGYDVRVTISRLLDRKWLQASLGRAPKRREVVPRQEKAKTAKSTMDTALFRYA